MHLLTILLVCSLLGVFGVSARQAVTQTLGCLLKLVLLLILLIGIYFWLSPVKPDAGEPKTKDTAPRAELVQPEAIPTHTPIYDAEGHRLRDYYNGKQLHQIFEPYVVPQ